MVLLFDRPRKIFTALISLLAAGCPLARGQTPSPFVSGVWSGNVTATSATVCVRLNAAGQTVRLAVGTLPALSSITFSSAVTSSATNGNVVTLNITGLQPDTDYFYGIEVAGVMRTETTSRGRFHTFPQGAGSFRLALVGDSDYRDFDQRSFDAVLAEQPLLILFNGDLHYSDINTTNPEDYRIPYDNVLKHPGEGALFRSAPVAYMWDDHDFTGGNDSNSTAIGSAATRAVYRDYVPHYPLNISDGTIGQSFTVGRVRIIMTDLRSAAVSPSLPESSTKTIMGAAQKAWFKQELIAARDAGFPLIFWVSSVPWIGAANLNGDDSWAGYATERTEIANFIKDNRIKNLVVLAGDMHAMAYDDGSHSDYATGGGAPLVVVHAAPLTQPSNTKGGPYTAGPFAASEQYGLLDITDTGGSTIGCRFTGKRVGEGVKLSFQFNVSTTAVDTSLPPAGPVGDRALVNISARGRLASSTDTLIAGFVITGRVSRNILLRAVGPSLAAFGVTDAIARPALALYHGSTIIASNDDWSLEDTTRLNAAFDRVGAFHFASSTSRDAAMFLNLPPGAYTLQVSNTAGATGSVLLEAYEVQ